MEGAAGTAVAEAEDSAAFEVALAASELEAAVGSGFASVLLSAMLAVVVAAAVQLHLQLKVKHVKLAVQSAQCR